MRIEVCICTYRRPEMLAALLADLQRQKLPTCCDLSILVVDNDPDLTAREVVECARQASYIPVRYAAEGASNIASARNRVLDEARAPILLFIDDDELPAPGWIYNLIRTASETNSDVVLGPVIPRFTGLPPKGVSPAFFERRRHKTGTPASSRDFRAGNALVRASTVEKTKVRFEEEFGFSGGEDFVFFASLARMGASMRWCDEACVYEWVPPERTSIPYLLRRSFNAGQTYIRALLHLEERAKVAKELCKASVFLLIAWAPFRLSRALWPDHVPSYQRRVAGCMGKLSAVVGLKSELYRSP